MEKSAPTEGQTLAWVGLCFVRQAYHLTTGHRLAPDKVETSAKKEGSTSIVDWLARSTSAESALGTALAASRTYFSALKRRCRKRKFSVEARDGGEPSVLIEGLGVPPREAQRHSAAATIHEWLELQIEAAIAPPESIRGANEYYDYLHTQWESNCVRWSQTVAKAFRYFTAVNSSHRDVEMPLAPFQVHLTKPIILWPAY